MRIFKNFYFWVIFVCVAVSAMDVSQDYKQQLHISIVEVKGTTIEGVCPFGTLILGKTEEKMRVKLEIVVCDQYGNICNVNDYVWIYTTKGHLEGEFMFGYPLMRLENGMANCYLYLEELVDSSTIEITAKVPVKYLVHSCSFTSTISW